MLDATRREFSTFCGSDSKSGRILMTLKVGDFIIVQKWKASTHPSLRAKETFPSRNGEMYSYRIDKFWKVVQIVDDKTIEVETRRGKRYRLEKNGFKGRKAGFFDRLFYRDRFF